MNLSRSETLSVLDLFAGPGGWDVALKWLGLDPLGVEWDDAACATREAAGLRTLQGNVAALDPSGFGPVDLFIASPPCQAWSMAGKRLGEKDKEHVIACAHELALGNDTRHVHGQECEDNRSMLVVEPLRFIRHLKPTYVALEQVPPVLELWTLFATFLEQWGYSVWTGVLEAERYGVPQTRERAILIASRRGPVAPPHPTHQRYIPGEPQRHDITFDGEVLPWVSMAEALGWKGDSFVKRERSGDRSEEGFDAAAMPCQSMTSKVRSWDRVAMAKKEDRPERVAQGAGNRPRGADKPAATIDTRTDLAKWEGVDIPAPTVTAGGTGSGGPEPFGRGGRERLARCYDRRQGSTKPNGEREMVRAIPETEPAPTIAADGPAKGRDVWTEERPSTTVACDPRIAPAGHHDNHMKDAIRVTEQEAATLQSFPPDYPFQGSRSKRFEQIGNAVPPLLALAILDALLPDPGEIEVAA